MLTPQDYLASETSKQGFSIQNALHSQVSVKDSFPWIHEFMVLCMCDNFFYHQYYCSIEPLYTAKLTVLPIIQYLQQTREKAFLQFRSDLPGRAGQVLRWTDLSNAVHRGLWEKYVHLSDRRIPPLWWSQTDLCEGVTMFRVLEQCHVR